MPLARVATECGFAHQSHLTVSSGRSSATLQAPSDGRVGRAGRRGATATRAQDCDTASARFGNTDPYPAPYHWDMDERDGVSGTPARSAAVREAAEAQLDWPTPQYQWKKRPWMPVRSGAIVPVDKRIWRWSNHRSVQDTMIVCVGSSAEEVQHGAHVSTTRTAR